MPKRYKLDVFDPLGKVLIRSFAPDVYGIVDGIAGSADPYTGCDTLTFQGRPDLVPIHGAEIFRAYIFDDAGVHAVYFGAAIKADPGDPDADTKPYEGNARTLLLGSACPPKKYRNMDTAAIALDVATRSAHPALTVRAQDFVNSGTVLDTFQTWDTDGSLAGIFDALTEATENPNYGGGIDPSGRLFFRPNETVLELDYADTDYDDMETTATTITTAVLWTYSTEPYGDYGGAYKPVPFFYTSIPDAELHERYGYTRPRKLPEYALLEGYNTAFTSSNFSNPGGAVGAGTGPATRNSGTTGNYTLNNDDPLVLGVRVKYQTSEDAGAVRLRASCGVLYDVELPNTKGEEQTLDIPLTPHEGAFTKWDWFRLTAASGGTMSLIGFYPLRVSTDILDGAAPAVVPEQRPGQATIGGIGVLPAVIRLKNSPRGDVELPCAGLRWTSNNEEEAKTVYDLGQSAYEAEAEGKTQAVKGYYRRPSS